MHSESHLHQDQWKALFKADCQVTAVILNEKVFSSEVRDTTVLLSSLGSFSSTARFSVTAFYHYSPLFSSPISCRNEHSVACCPSKNGCKTWKLRQNQKLQENVIISMFSSSQLTNGMRYSFPLQTDISAKPKTFVNCSYRKTKTKPPPSSCWYPPLNTET